MLKSDDEDLGCYIFQLIIFFGCTITLKFNRIWSFKFGSGTIFLIEGLSSFYEFCF